MDVQLKMRKESKIRDLKFDITFKIPESSYLFMRVDVDALAVHPKEQVNIEHPEIQEPPVIHVIIPDGKLPVICLNTGKAQWMNAHEEVQIVEFQAKEIFREEE